ncbi:MAG TPA: acyltransferase [Acidimicrobiales bacterium]
MPPRGARRRDRGRPDHGWDPPRGGRASTTVGPDGPETVPPGGGDPFDARAHDEFATGGYDPFATDSGIHDLDRTGHPGAPAPPVPGPAAPPQRRRSQRPAPDRRGEGRRGRRSDQRATGAEDEEVRLPRVPALDGLRGLLLVGVLAFHQGFDLVRGGFLAISSFATLAGFFATTLLLAEWSRSGRVSLARFWDRRARRLAPTVILVLAAVVALQVVLRVGAGPGFRGDVLAAVGQALNWRYAIDGDGFTSIFTDPSPVQHLWAVGILVQLLVVLPLVFVGLMSVAGRAWRVSGVLFALLAGGSFAAAYLTAQQAGNDGFAYFGTHARAGELLVGVVLAYAVLSPRVRGYIESRPGAAALRVAAPVSLGALAVLWSITSFHDPNLFRGITAANALLTAVVILAATVPGPVHDALGTPLLRALGTVAFAAFVVHWPLYLVLDRERLDIPAPALFVARVAASLLLAALITWALERPIRRSLAVPRLQMATGLGVTAALVAVAVVVLPEQPPENVSLTMDNGREAGDLDVVVPTGDEVGTIALVGDGLAGSLVPGLEAWNADEPGRQVRVHTHIGEDCGLAAKGPIRLGGDAVGDDLVCTGWAPRLPPLLDAADPDVVVVVGGLGELGSREIDRAWRNIGDPVYDDWLAGRLDDLADTLTAPGVPVLWATQPHVRLEPAGDAGDDWTDLDENDPARVDRFNELVKRVAAAHDGITVVDLDAWAHSRPGGEFGEGLRDEGRHLSLTGSVATSQWLMAEVLDAIGVEAADAEAGDGEAGDAGDTGDADGGGTDDGAGDADGDGGGGGGG